MSIKPLDVQNLLVKAPQNQPKYHTSIKDSKGNDIICGDPKMTRALLALMNLGAVNGGAACHWGGPAAMAEMMSAVHSKMFEQEDWFNHYNFINDIGHAENGIYALRANLGYGDLDYNALKGFRSINSKLTGHGESHIYPEGVLLSNGPLSSSLPQAQGLAFGDALAGRKRTTIISMSDGAAMEGEAKESFTAIPGLRAAGKCNPFVLIISDNNTKLSGRISEDSFDMTPSFEAMANLGWETIKVEKGNDLQACYTALENALEKASSDKPVFVWLKTVKGYGVKSTMEAKSGGHGFPLKAYSEDIYSFLDEITGNNTPEEFKAWASELTKKPEAKAGTSTGVKKEKAQAGFSRAAAKAVTKGLPVISVSSDLQGSTGMAAFHKEYPSHALDLGIAESNMVSHAAGLSKAGYIPVVDTFAAFGVTKGNLPFIMAALSSCPMIAVFSHTGFQDAADGASHQSLTYLAAMSSIPYTRTVVVSTSEEAESLMLEAMEEIAKHKESGTQAYSYIFFVGRENYPVTLDAKTSPKLGKAQLLKEGKDGVLLSVGATLFKALDAAEKLSSDGVDVSVINHSSTNVADIELLTQALKSAPKLVTIEDHQVIGGLGAFISQSLHNCGIEAKVKTLGVAGTFGQSAYKADELYEKHGLSTQNIINVFKEL